MNAVFERDYVAFSGSVRFLLYRGGLAGAVGLLFALQVLTASASGGNYAGVSTALLKGTGLIGFGLLATITPASFATVLVHARQARSLPVLMTTPLSPLSIAWGAFASRAGLLMLLVLATVPPISFAMLYGGIQGLQIIYVALAAGSLVLWVGAPSLLISAYARRTTSAVVAAYLVAAALIGGLYATATAIDGGTPVSAAISPVHALVAAFDVQQVDAAASVIVLFLGGALVSAGAVFVTAWRLQREATGDDEGRAGYARHTECRPIRRANPVLDIELRRAAFWRRRSPAHGLFALLLLVEGGFVVHAMMGGELRSIDLHGWVLSFQLLLITLAVTAAGATALAADKETNTIELLRAAPLKPAHVVIGKLAGVLRGLLPCLLVPVAHVVALTVLGLTSPLAVVLVPVVGTVVLATWAIVALHQSLDQRSPARAVFRTMTLLGIVALLVSFTLGTPMRAVLDQGDPYLTAAGAYGANPVAAMMLPVAILRTGGSTVGSTSLAGPSANAIGAGVVILGIWVALHVAFATHTYTRLARLYRTRYEA